MAESKLFTTTKFTRQFLVYLVVFVVVMILLQACVSLASRPSTQLPLPSSAPVTNLTTPYNDLPAGVNLQTLGVTYQGNPNLVVNAGITTTNDQATVTVKSLGALPQLALGKQLGEQLAQKLGMATSSTVQGTDTLLWQTESKTLTFNAVTGLFSYVNSTYTASSLAEVNKLSPTSYYPALASLLAQLFPSADVASWQPFSATETLAGNFVRPRGADLFAVQSGPAELLRLRYLPVTDQLAVYSSNPLQEPLVVTVAAGAIQQDTVTPAQLYTFTWKVTPAATESRNYPLLPFAQLWPEFQHQGALLTLTVANEDELQFARLAGRNLTSLTADIVSLSYVNYQTAGNSYLLPVYYVTGTAVLQDGRTGKFSGIISAI